MRPASGLLIALLLSAGPALAAVTGFEVTRPPETLALAVAPELLSTSPVSILGDRTARPAKKARRKRGEAAEDPTVFSAHRAAMLMRSLTVPGWGQASLGRRRAAAAFAVTELGVWSAFTAFNVQGAMRRETYVRTARLYAGIDLRGRDEEFRRIVGAFASSEEYNLLVVSRDAANLYMQDVYNPDMASYRAYIAAHSLGGASAWSWEDYSSFKRFGTERKQAQRAALRANSMLAIAIANRIASALHAARSAGRAQVARPEHTSWNVEIVPGNPGERVLFRTGLRARF